MSEFQEDNTAVGLEGGPYLIQSSPRAMVQLALRSACTISTLLCIPDGFAIMPDSANPLAWLVRMTGLWLSGYCLWTFGFLVMLYVVRVVTRGIELNADGFKLWRFGKLVRWDAVRAVTCEEQPFFSKAFCLKPMARRLTIYSEKADGKLAPHSIPSFQFDPKDFDSLLIFVSEKCFAVVPSASELLISTETAMPVLKQSYERGRLMRVAMSAVIAVSLVSFLGRKAVVNYTFNTANKAFRAEHYVDAIRNYKIATSVDPTFAPAWDRLARSEYRAFKETDAEEHYNKALQMRPDMVESKIGLATILAKRRQYGAARKLLLKALKLSPTNLAAAMSLGDLDIRTMQYSEAIEVLKPLAEAQESNERARGLLARAYLRSGRVTEAHEQLAKRDHPNDNAMSDLAFVQLVGAEVAVARRDFGSAEKQLEGLTKPFSSKHQELPEDLLLAWIALRSAQCNQVELDKLLEEAHVRRIPADEIDVARQISLVGGARSW